MSETPLYTQMSNLLFYANNLTGEADEHLGDAVYKLGLGYGQGDPILDIAIADAITDVQTPTESTIDVVFDNTKFADSNYYPFILIAKRVANGTDSFALTGQIRKNKYMYIMNPQFFRLVSGSTPTEYTASLKTQTTSYARIQVSTLRTSTIYGWKALVLNPHI